MSRANVIYIPIDSGKYGVTSRSDTRQSEKLFIRVFLLAFQQCLSRILNIDRTNTFQMVRNYW